MHMIPNVLGDECLYLERDGSASQNVVADRASLGGYCLMRAGVDQSHESITFIGVISFQSLPCHFLVISLSSGGRVGSRLSVEVRTSINRTDGALGLVI
jgi:hypothetical protein